MTETSPHSHTHSVLESTHQNIAHMHERTLWWALALTGGFMAIEFFGGLWAGSLALVADSLHMLTDTAALGLALFAVVWSKRHADEHRNYGYGRLQVLAAFVNGLTVLGLAAVLWAQAIRRFWSAPAINDGLMFWVALAGLFVNLAIFVLLHKSHQGSLNIRAAALHVLGDMVSSAAVVLAALVIGRTGLTWIDPLATLVVAAMIANSSRKIISETSHILLEGRPRSFDGAKVAAAIRNAVPEVIGIHHLHAWSLSGEDVLLTLHAPIDEHAARSDDEVLVAIKTVLVEQFHITHSTVQVERAGCADVQNRLTSHDHAH
jgi:cobalt-zinc-cadmium efflux system protein